MPRKASQVQRIGEGRVPDVGISLLGAQAAPLAGRRWQFRSADTIVTLLASGIGRQRAAREIANLVVRFSRHHDHLPRLHAAAGQRPTDRVDYRPHRLRRRVPIAKNATPPTSPTTMGMMVATT